MANPNKQRRLDGEDYHSSDAFLDEFLVGNVVSYLTPEEIGRVRCVNYQHEFPWICPKEIHMSLRNHKEENVENKDDNDLQNTVCVGTWTRPVDMLWNQLIVSRNK